MRRPLCYSMGQFMNQPAANGLVLERRRHIRRRHSRIPVDTVLWLFFFGLLLPLGTHAGWFHPATPKHNVGEHMLLGLAMMFGILGAILLGAARYPLYVRRHHHGFLPRELPHDFRVCFWLSYVLISVGSATLLALLLIQHWR